MYKSDLFQALTRLDLVPGGTVEGLLRSALAAKEQIDAAVAQIASRNDSTIKAGITRLHQALHPISARLAEISSFATVVELHQVSDRFDEVMANYPALEGLLRPGRQAISALAGAFDVMLKDNRSSPSVFGLVSPGVELALCLQHYAALKELFSGERSHLYGESDFAIVELDEAQNLQAVADALGLLATLAQTAQRALMEADPGDSGLRDHNIEIASIESGSPIKIELSGESKTLELLLAMLRDAIRALWRRRTPHGRVVEAMETLAKAKELGIESKEALAHLSSAVVEASAQYSDEFRSRRVVIDGELVDPKSAALSLPGSDLADDGAPPAKLPPPSS
jgi:hypothetical protein